MSENSIEKTFTIVNTLGLHARAATNLVRMTSRFQSTIKLRKGNYVVDGKSVLGVLSLAVPRGSQITVIAEGPDSKEAMEKIGALIESGFGEGVHKEKV